MTQIIYMTRSNQIISDETLDQIESNTDGIEDLLQEIADNTAGGGGGGGGDASAANQTTIIGHLDGVETLITATNAALAAAIPAGDNNIGNVDVVTLPATPAGTNLIGRISASTETSTVYDGTTALVPKFAIIDAATSGNNTLVAAVASKKIRVLSLMLVAAGTVNVRFESGADGTALSGQMQLTAQTGFSLPFSPVGWFETASNTLLNLELSGAISCDGLLVYVEV